MFIILLKFEGRTGKYPVVYSTPGKTGGEHVVSLFRWNHYDNAGAMMTAADIAKEIPKFLGLPGIQTVEVHRM